jgi:hypothetical protein
MIYSVTIRTREVFCFKSRDCYGYNATMVTCSTNLILQGGGTTNATVLKAATGLKHGHFIRSIQLSNKNQKTQSPLMLNIVVKWVAHLICNRQVPGSKFSPEMDNRH